MPSPARVVELATYLDARSRHDAAPAPAATTVTVHDSCHGLRELGVKAQPRRLLAEQGVEVVESDGAERCCGFGGTFCVKLPAVSVAMADDRLDEWTRVPASRPSSVGTSPASCHLEGRARRRSLPLRFRHLAEVLRPSADEQTP